MTIFKNSAVPVCTTIIHTLLLSISGYVATAAATEYVAVSGSMVIIKELKGQLPPTGSTATVALTQGFAGSSPLLGGISNDVGNCFYNYQILTVDGWRGIKLNSNNIIGGFTGSVLGGEVKIKKNNDNTQQESFSGGFTIDPSGVATAQGSVGQASANNYCGAINPPYGDPDDPMGNLLSAPDNTGWGNKLATVDVSFWVYVPRDTSPGSYPLAAMNFSQGPQTGLFSSMSVTLNSDTILVVPPPCTISTNTNIIFDASSLAGRKVSAPITYQCDQITNNPLLDAYLVVAPVGETLTPTELALTIDGSKPGGAVRGYAGSDVDINSVNCVDTVNSIQFDRNLKTKLGNVATGTTSIPLVWQLCPQGDEETGIATGSAILEIGYK
jgi:hypothetical protein